MGRSRTTVQALSAETRGANESAYIKSLANLCVCVCTVKRVQPSPDLKGGKQEPRSSGGEGRRVQKRPSMRSAPREDGFAA